MRTQPLEDVISHWSKLIENFTTSSTKLYAAVEKGLERRKLPEATITRVAWSEGGVLSPNREYLRIEGSGFVYDICAAPFGTGFFFSEWLTRKRAEYVFYYLSTFVFGAWLISRFLATILYSGLQNQSSMDLSLLAWRAFLLSPGFIGSVSLLIALLIVGVLARAGFRGPALALGTVPLLGPLFDRLFMPITYYNLDTAAMFRATVHAAVLEAIDDLTTQKGLRALAPEDRKPEYELVPLTP